MSVIAQDRAPAAGPGIPAAGPVGVQFDCFHIILPYKLPCARGAGAKRLRGRPLCPVPYKLPCVRGAGAKRLRGRPLCPVPYKLPCVRGLGSVNRRLTQGGGLRGRPAPLCPLLHDPINISTYTLKVIPKLIVGDPKDFQVIPFQVLRSASVFFLPLLFVMLGPVQFNDEFCFRAIKICDISPQHLLPVKADRVKTKKLIPELSLFLGHLFSQVSGQGNKFPIPFSIHLSLPYMLPV